MLNRHGGGFTPSTMIPDAQTFRAFYASPKGELARGVIGQRLGLRLQVSQQQRILGLGYTVPYLDTFSSTAKLVIAAQPANMGVAHGQSAVLVEDETLPFADALFDWVIAVHAIELCENLRRTMREIWRVLAQDGRVLLVVPNRTSLWAQLENSPFGHGRPYTRGQVERLLEECLFRAESWDTALFFPPFGCAAACACWDRVGHKLWPRLGGVHIVEATKSLYAPVPPARVPKKGRLVVRLAR